MADIPKEATRLFSGVFFSLIGAWGDTFSFRRIVGLGIPEAAERLVDETARGFRRFIDDAEHDEVFGDNKAKFLEAHGGVKGVALELSKQQLNTFNASVDAASLVFMHSALDTAVYDLCRVVVLVAPQAAYPFIDNRKELLGEVRARGYEELARERLHGFIDELSREPLVKKTDRIFQVCGARHGYSRAGYEFDRGRLQAIDDRRNEVIHRNVRRASIPDIDVSLQYLLDTGLFLFGLVNHRFGVRVDAEQWPS